MNNGKSPGNKQKVTFPHQGLPREELMPLMKSLKSKDANWRSGKAFSLVFFPGDEVAEVIEEAYNTYFFENGLNPTVFPSLRKFETEVVSMAADLLNGDADVAGNMTSGGTESILMAVKTARDKAVSEKPGIKPELVVPLSVHPAFEKAGHYFDIKIVHAGLGEDKRVDVDEVEKAINKNTIMLVGSAPAYPHGVVDPIEALGALALKHKLLLHVDACVGGFMLPFVEKLGNPVPVFDFRVPGVTSMSCDLHKYGYSAKGSSIVLYRNSELRKHQYFVYTDWPGGIYASPSISGTRPGGAIAASWAILKLLGEEGYLKIAAEVMQTTQKFIEGINAIEGLHVISNPDMSVFAFASDSYDIFAIGDELTLKGWHLDRQHLPNCLHMTISRPHARVVDEFLKDLKDAVATVKKLSWNKVTSKLTVSMVNGISKVLPEKTFSKFMEVAQKAGGSKFPTRTAAMYGLAGSLPNRGDIYDMILNLMDTLNKVD